LRSAQLSRKALKAIAREKRKSGYQDIDLHLVQCWGRIGTNGQEKAEAKKASSSA
jgi:predicted DNA-binding WGR domain protein